MVSSFLGFVLCSLSLYTQKDAGALNIMGLAIIDIVLVINFFLVRKQKEKINIPRILENIEVIDGTIKRISKIISSLQMISRQEHVEGKLINPSETIRNVIPISNINMDSEHIQFEAQLDDKIKFYGSQIQLSQIILNLLNNAIYAAKEVESPKVKITCYKQDEKIIIQVFDSGLGVPIHLVNKIFEPFYTSKPIGEGTGLGLSLCRSIAESMGGISSIEGKITRQFLNFHF